MDVSVVVRIDVSERFETLIRSLFAGFGAARASAPETAQGSQAHLAPGPVAAPVEQMKPLELPIGTPPVQAAPSVRWTEERNEALATGIAAGVTALEMTRQLNLLPGLPLTVEHVRGIVGYRRLKPAVSPAAPAPMPLVEVADPPLASPVEVLADDATIRHWAGSHGLAHQTAPIDLTVINRKRIQLGLLPFVRSGRLAASAATIRPAMSGAI